MKLEAYMVRAWWRREESDVAINQSTVSRSPIQRAVYTLCKQFKRLPLGIIKIQ